MLPAFWKKSDNLVLKQSWRPGLERVFIIAGGAFEWFSKRGWREKGFRVRSIPANHDAAQSWSMLQPALCPRDCLGPKATVVVVDTEACSVLEQAPGNPQIDFCCKLIPSTGCKKQPDPHCPKPKRQPKLRPTEMLTFMALDSGHSMLASDRGQRAFFC